MVIVVKDSEENTGHDHFDLINNALELCYCEYCDMD